MLKAFEALFKGNQCGTLGELPSSITDQLLTIWAAVQLSQSRTGLGSRHEYVAYTSLGSIITM